MKKIINQFVNLYPLWNIGSFILGFKERGMVREGCFADLVLMDLESVRDLATFEDPYQYPEGIDYVMVNGELGIESGEFTWNLPGRVLTPSSEQ